MADTTRTILVNFYDDGWDFTTLADIRDQIEEYAKAKGYEDVQVLTIIDNTHCDEENGRYDIEIICCDTVLGKKIRQKLLYLRGELLDRAEFSERYEEFYGTRMDMGVVV